MMCGRYFIGSENEDERLDHYFEQAQKMTPVPLRRGEIRPGMDVLVLSNTKPQGEVMTWGLSGMTKLINARAETVRDKPTFAPLLKVNRCAVPASGFYEWNASKEKIFFRDPEASALYFAGIFTPGDERRFCILTVAAQGIVRSVHDRMPLILKPDQIETWLFGDYLSLLQVADPELQAENQSQREQLKLF